MRLTSYILCDGNFLLESDSCPFLPPACLFCQLFDDQTPFSHSFCPSFSHFFLFCLNFFLFSILFCSHLAPFSVSFMGQHPCDWWWVVTRLYPVIITRFMANRVPKIRPTSLMNNKDCREIRVEFHHLSAFLRVKNHVLISNTRNLVET